MLFETPCPKCAGPAYVQNNTLTCALCGDQAFVEEKPEAVEEKRPDLSVVATAVAEVPPDFPRASVSLTLPEQLVKEFDLDDSAKLERQTEIALEFLFGYLEAAEGLPQEEIPSEGRVLEVELVSSHSYTLQQLAEQLSKSQSELASIGLLSYLRAEREES